MMAVLDFNDIIGISVGVIAILYSLCHIFILEKNMSPRKRKTMIFFIFFIFAGIACLLIGGLAYR